MRTEPKRPRKTCGEEEVTNSDTSAESNITVCARASRPSNVPVKFKDQDGKVKFKRSRKASPEFSKAVVTEEICDGSEMSCSLEVEAFSNSTSQCSECSEEVKDGIKSEKSRGSSMSSEARNREPKPLIRAMRQSSLDGVHPARVVIEPNNTSTRKSKPRKKSPVPLPGTKRKSSNVDEGITLYTRGVEAWLNPGDRGADS